MLQQHFESIGKGITPKPVREGFERIYFKLRKKTPYKRFGIYFYGCILLALAIYFFVIKRKIEVVGTTHNLIFGISSIVVLYVVLLILCYLGEYIRADVLLYNRIKTIEKYLPDYLELVAANLRGGMILEQAMWNAIRPEFGALSEEMGMIAKRVITGEDMARVLKEFASKYKSPLLIRTFEIFIEELSSGGEMAMILEKIVENIRSTKELRDELAASTIAYVIFISLIVIFIAPVLFALSFQLISMISKVAGSTSTLIARGAPTVGFARVGSSIVDPMGYKTFSLIAISIISFVASLIISIVQKGSAREGIRYVPFFILGSMGIYLIALKILESIFGGIGI